VTLTLKIILDVWKLKLDFNEFQSKKRRRNKKEILLFWFVLKQKYRKPLRL